MQHPNEEHVEILAKDQLMKMAITEDEKEDLVKGTGNEPEEVVTEEEAVKVVSDEPGEVVVE